MQVLESLGFDQHGNLHPQQPVQHQQQPAGLDPNGPYNGNMAGFRVGEPHDVRAPGPFIPPPMPRENVPVMEPFGQARRPREDPGSENPAERHRQRQAAEAEGLRRQLNPDVMDVDPNLVPVPVDAGLQAG